jgi:beta-glucosidase
MPFPKQFVWGAATASYQIEGAALEDGRGECIWTRFSHTPGKVINGDTGDIACDHYHRYPQDIELMRQIGLDAYRFSVSWPRVLPVGHGVINQAGLAFYDRLVDALLEAGITPYLTLYHWDLPQALQDDGDGWENPSIVPRFADYAAIMAQTLGDRVKHWITLNEPWVIAFLGNQLGIHAPGKQDLGAAYRVAHHLMLAHAAAVPRLREWVADAQVGITLDYADMHPASDDPADVAMARRYDGYKNRWFLDAVFKGTYPADVVAAVRGVEGALEDIDLGAVREVAVPLDFLGLNYYTRHLLRDDGSLLGEQVHQTERDRTAMGWEIYPEGLYNMLTRVQADYAPAALYITENGCAMPDPEPDESGIVADPRRVAYLKDHFTAAERALMAGVPLAGYFVWSLLDNFEWAEGYNKRFGIVRVDYDTLERYMKHSALWYRDMIGTRSV